MNVLSRRLAARTSFARTAVNYRPVRTLVTLKESKYTAKATATGAGRNGEVESDGLKLSLKTPKELGGTGGAQNPEQLFAMGYAGCFLGALQFKANELGKPEAGAKAVVHTEVSIGPSNELPGFALEVNITVEGVDSELVQAAHAFCPYSRAVKDGIIVKVKAA
ncbi:organic hydroperoxide resistance protein [Coprinopsis marcescibilis]|uniref:Organic hydroperoxide resistance protein n=1 Tax=Coprinopsis marcescibilis TaxID=230819 RepID=A0A5C3L1W2_COPMA|nr:organic hydroperoxide resistance protein [Coprinopsis marcescibilis]